jgi:hypothetical protein
MLWDVSVCVLCGVRGGGVVNMSHTVAEVGHAVQPCVCWVQPAPLHKRHTQRLGAAGDMLLGCAWQGCVATQALLINVVLGQDLSTVAVQAWHAQCGCSGA